MEIRTTEIGALMCPETVKSGLSRYISCLADILEDNLLGVIVHGSLARDCYQPVTSDVDLIVVIRERTSDPLAFSVLQAHRYAKLAADAVVVTYDQINSDVFPTPLEFAVKPISDGELHTMPGGSPDLLLQRQDAYEAGISLTGLQPRQLLQPVPWPLLAQSLDYLFPNIVPHFKNPMLMLCRVAYAWSHHQLCSKQQAGEWACEEFGPQWSQVITTALLDYACGNTGMATPRESVRALERYCTDYIEGLRQGAQLVMMNCE